MLILDSNPDQLERVVEFLDAFCDRHALSEELRYHLNIALEELVLNAIRHGRCEPAEGAIRLAMRLEDDTLHIELSDSGVPFNPLERSAPDLRAAVAQRPIGGLGIHLVRSLMESFRYERRDGRNLLFLTKRVTK